MNSNTFNSNNMKECMVTPQYVPQTTTDISFKQHVVNLKDLPLGSRTYETPMLPSNVALNPHNVGQLENNLYKLKRILEKTNFTDNLNMQQLHAGDPS